MSAPSSSLALALVWLLPLLCAAETGTERSARGHHERCITLYRAERLPEALRECQQAYAGRPHPRVLQSIARLHQKLGRLHDALQDYTLLERGCRRRQVGAADCELIRSYKKDVEVALHEQEQARLAAVSRTRRTLRIAGWVAGGISALALAAGATLLVLDGRQTCELMDTGARACPEILSTAPAGIALVAGGAALLGTSGLLLGFGYRKDRQGVRSSMVSLQGGF